jgi:hypothetical protein
LGSTPESINSKTVRSPGRHRRPSRVHKIAKRASIAVPALAVSGALAAAPHALAATTPGAAATTHPITAQLDAAVHPAAAAFTTYTVHPGDTLSGIAFRFLGRAGGWHELYLDNRSKISNPNVISAGMVLTIPRHLSTADHSGKRRSAGEKKSVGRRKSDGDRTRATGRKSTGRKSSGRKRTSDQHSGRQGAAHSSGGDSVSMATKVQQDVASGNYLLAVGQYLVENGYSDAAAAGVASCIYGESTGNPESVGTGGGGLIGWTPIGSAEPNPNIITGNASQDMMTQLGDLLYYNSGEIGQPLVEALNSQTDPVAAADFYSQNFEKPAVTDSDVVPSVAEQIFSALGG